MKLPKSTRLVQDKKILLVMKRVLLVASLLLISIVLLNLPTFYFNELELGFRQNFFNAYVAADKAEQGIALRQKGTDKADDEVFSGLGKAIESELHSAIVSLDKAETYNKRQEKIAFLLPNKYREYLDLKEKSLAGYYQLSDDFRQRKHNEHLTTETMMLIVHIDQTIYNIENYGQWLETLDQLPQNSERIKTNADTLLANNHINQELHGYIIKTVKGYEHAATLFIDALENDDWSGFDFSGLAEFKTPENEVRRMLEELKEDMNQRSQKHLDKAAENNQTIMIANEYFNKHKLALDPISRFFSAFSSRFPRIKITDDHEPTIIPKDIPPGLVS